jgi:heme-degrading monooxygenase HmoA
VPSLLIRHRVADFAAWSAVFADQEVMRRANGSRGGRILRTDADSREILVILEWDDLERARLFVDSDDLQGAMQRAGVIGNPEFWFLEDVDSTSA